MRAKADEAEAFLRRENWHVGVWEIREAGRTGELTIRPDGQYTAKDEDAFFRELCVDATRERLGASTFFPASVRMCLRTATANSARSSGHASFFL